MEKQANLQWPKIHISTVRPRLDPLDPCPGLSQLTSSLEFRVIGAVLAKLRTFFGDPHPFRLFTYYCEFV